MPDTTIYVRLSCLTCGADETPDDDDFVEPSDQPINPESEDDPAQ